MYGNPRMHNLHIWIQDLISHVETISLCIWLVTEISLYANRHLTNPCMQNVISVMRYPYAYCDHQDPHMHKAQPPKAHLRFSGREKTSPFIFGRNIARIKILP